MYKIRFFRHTKVSHALFFTYLAVLLLPLIAGIVVYTLATNAIETEVSNSNRLMVEDIKKNIATEIAKVISFATQIRFDTHVNRILFGEDVLDPEYKLSIWRVVSNLDSYTLANSYIELLYLYLHRQNLIVAPGATFEKYQFYHKHYGRSNLPFERWEKMIEVDSYAGYTTFSNASSNDGSSAESLRSESELLLFYTKGIPLTGRDRKRAGIVIEFDTRMLVEQLEIYHNPGQQNLLVDGNGEILFSAGSDLIQHGNQVEQVLEEEGFLKTIKLPDGRITLTGAWLPELDWYFISVVPQRYFHQQARSIRILYLSVSMASLLGGIGIVYLFTKTTDFHLTKIITLLSENENKLQEDERNEYRYIVGAVKKLMSEKNWLVDKYHSQKAALQRNFLSRLVMGKINPASFEELEANHNVSFLSNSFWVTVIYPDPIAVQHHENRAAAEKIDLLKTQLEKLLGEEFRVYTTDVGDFEVLIINAKLSLVEGYVDAALLVAGFARSLPARNLGEFKLASSSRLQSLQSLNLGYSQALEVVEYFSVTRREVVCYDEMVSNRGDLKRLSLRITGLREFSRNTSLGLYNKAMRQLDDIIHQLTSGPYIAVDILHLRMESIINALLDALGENYYSALSGGTEGADLVNRFAECHDLSSLRSEIDAVFNEISTNTIPTPGEKLVDKVDRYIEKHYGNLQLNVASIAGYLMCNASYLSRTYKAKSGIGVLEKINAFRVSRAIELLKNTETTINVITRMVGYSSPGTFIRIFKKHTGITPGKMRELQGKNEIDR